MTKLSIIVPVYYVEPYLPKCIDSILAQTMTDFELLLIVDGSPDRCAEICDSYAAKDNRIIVIHQQNHGVSAARNAGLKIAKGEYIGFVDPDDWIEFRMYEKMIKTAKQDNADVVACGINYYDSDYILNRSELLTAAEYDNKQMLLELFGTPNRFGGMCWNKIFLREAILGVLFPVGIKYCEDWTAVLDFLAHCKKLVQISNPFYNVLERTGSATRIGVIVYYNIIRNGEIVFVHTKPLLKDIRCAAMEKVLDNCLRYGELIKKDGKKNREKYNFLLFKVKIFMIKNLIISLFLRLLHKNQFHRFCSEMIKL